LSTTRGEVSIDKGVDLETAGRHLAWDYIKIRLLTLFVDIKTRGAHRQGFSLLRAFSKKNIHFLLIYAYLCLFALIHGSKKKLPVLL
jgi:hypothetical protein